MNLQPKIEPGSPPGFHFINNTNLESKSIPDLIMVLRAAVMIEDFNIVEEVLVSRDKRLREEIQQLQEKFEVERKELQEKFDMEKITRFQCEMELKKKEELCEKGRIAQKSYEALMLQVKKTGFGSGVGVIGELRKKRNELEFEVKKLEKKCFDDSVALDVVRKKNSELEKQVMELMKLKGKRVEDSVAFDVLRKKNDELENKVMELMKLKGKWVEDCNELNVLKKRVGELKDETLELKKLKQKWVDDINKLDLLTKKNGELENEVLELRRLKEKGVEDSKALDELRSKIRVLEDEKISLAGFEVKNGELEELVNKHLITISELRKEKNKLADEKHKVEVLLESLNKKYRELHERVVKLEDDTKLLMSVDASNGTGNNKGEPPADPIVAAFEDNIVEAAPLQSNEDAHHSHGVAASASTQPQIKGSKETQGASSGKKCQKVYTRRPKKMVEMAGSSEASATMKLKKNIEIINLDDDDDDDDQSISRGVNEKKTIFGVSVKSEYPTPRYSLEVEKKNKLANEVDIVKRKFHFSDSDTSTSTSSSGDSSSLDNLSISSFVFNAKRKKI